MNDWFVTALTDGVPKTVVNDCLEVTSSLLNHGDISKMGIFGRELLAEVLNAHLKTLGLIGSEAGRMLYQDVGQGVTVTRG